MYIQRPKTHCYHGFTSFSDEYPNIVWTGAGKKTPILIFKPEAIEKKEPAFKVIGGKWTFTVFYKFWGMFESVLLQYLFSL